jgi:hypothetical protein
MTLKAGTSEDFANSMAAAIERAMQQEWPKVMGADSAFESNPQLRLLCIAVAQGVVRHLVDQAAAGILVQQTGGESAHSHTLTVAVQTSGTLY